MLVQLQFNFYHPPGGPALFACDNSYNPHQMSPSPLQLHLHHPPGALPLSITFTSILQKTCPFRLICSSISITRLAAATQRPERVVGLHFMNPVRMLQQSLG